MAYRIFYSYQSDSPKELNEHFIEGAIEGAIKRINGVEIELVKGFSRTSGNKPLAETMFDQSANSDIFIGDVTFTMAKQWHNYLEKVVDEDSTIIKIPNGDLKPAPNPNVLLETGYSWCHKNYDRTILVLNTAFGEPADLPADFGDLRWPIGYHLTEEELRNDEYATEVKEKLENSFVGAIKAALKAAKNYQEELLQPLVFHENWTSSDFKEKFIVTNEVKTIVKKLRDGVFNHQTQRLVGPTGCGKTRIAKEFLRKIDSELKRDESINGLLYFYNGENYDAIAIQILKLKKLNQGHIIVLDNCPANNHKRLMDDLYGSNLRIITLFDSEIQDEYATIPITNELKEQVLNAKASSQSPKKSSQLIEKSNGSINRLNFYLNNSSREDELLDDKEIWQNISKNTFRNEAEFNLISLISLFEKVGFDFENAFQINFIRNYTPDISNARFYQLVEELINKDILFKRGDYLSVQNYLPIFYSNATKFISRFQIPYFIEQLCKNKLANGFTVQLHTFSAADFTKPIHDIIFDAKSPIFHDDFINTDGGSQLIFGLVELTPETILSILEGSIHGKSAEELLELNNGRRNIVWALDYLVSKEEYFERAAILLYKLAFAENEDYISNNATGQFSHLFQVQLSGTKSNLESRYILFKSIFEEEKEFNSILIKAANSALITGSWIGFGRPTRTGENTFDDYKPVTDEEVLTYWKSFIDLLLQAKSENSYGVVLNNFRAQFSHGNKEAIWAAAQYLFAEKGEMIESWRLVLESTLAEDEVAEEDKAAISAIIKKYAGEQIKDDLKYKVAIAPYSVSRKGDERIDQSKLVALELANELFVDGKFTWLEHIELLLTKDQRQTYEFGRECGRLSPNNEELIDCAISGLEKLDVPEQNNSLVLGYLSCMEDKGFVKSSIDKFIENKKVAFQAFNLTRVLDISFEDIEKLKPVVALNNEFVLQFHFYRLSGLNDYELKNTIEWVKRDEPYGWWTAIVLVEHALREREEWSKDIVQLVKGLFMKPNLCKGEGIAGWFSFNIYTELLEALSKYELPDELVGFVTQEIVEATREFNVPNKYEFVNILKLFFELNWDIAWSVVAKEIQNKDGYGWYNLKEIMEGCARHIEDQKFLDWMKENPDDGPQYIIQYVPFETNEAENDFTPIVKEMLNRYSGNEKFLSELSAKLHSYTCSGSAVPINEQRKALVGKLKEGYPNKVTEFAKKQEEYFDHVIEREKRNDDNWSLNY